MLSFIKRTSNATISSRSVPIKIQKCKHLAREKYQYCVYLFSGMLKLVKSVCRIYRLVGFYLPIKTYCVIACSVDLMMEMMLVIWTQNLFSHSAARQLLKRGFLGRQNRASFTEYHHCCRRVAFSISLMLIFVISGLIASDHRQTCIPHSLHATKSKKRRLHSVNGFQRQS